jgi:hypothetical protein
MVKKKCGRCNKTLPMIGTDRKNGKEFLSQANNNKDWIQREYHKKCWKIEQQEQEFMRRCREAQKKWKKREEAKAWLDMLEEEINEENKKL